MFQNKNKYTSPPKWVNMEDQDDMNTDSSGDESENESDDNTTEISVDSDEDPSSESENEEEQVKDSYKMDTLVDFLDDINNGEWEGNMDKDLQNVKEVFEKYLIGIKITKTDLFKKFYKEFEKNKLRLNDQYLEDGVQKTVAEVQEDAFDDTFTFLVADTRL